MTRTDRGKEKNFDPEIEKTAKRLKKETARLKSLSKAPLIPSSDNLEEIPEFFELPELEIERVEMAQQQQQRTLRN